MSWRGAAAKTGHSIVMADPHKFKYVNDSFGHQAGDAVLREAAARMRSSFGCYDSVGRYGGEVWNLGERFRLLISASPFTFGHSLLAITCSIGAPPSLPGLLGCRLDDPACG